MTQLFTARIIGIQYDGTNSAAIQTLLDEEVDIAGGGWAKTAEGDGQVSFRRDDPTAPYVDMSIGDWLLIPLMAVYTPEILAPRFIPLPS